jgi:hypothetical protein
MHFPIRARYLVSCSLPRTLATCAAAVFDCQNWQANTFDPDLQSCPKFKDGGQTHVCHSPVNSTMLWQGEEPRLWNCPPSSCHGVLYPRYYRLVGTFSCNSAPARGTRGVVLLSPKVWKGCHCLGTRDWYLMHYSNPFVTGGQKHTHSNAISSPSGTTFACISPCRKCT